MQEAEEEVVVEEEKLWLLIIQVFLSSSWVYFEFGIYIYMCVYVFGVFVFKLFPS